MCGIFGIIGSYDKQKVELSLQKMQTRGPDNSKVAEFHGGCFAQNRLSIIAPSHEYDPPFADDGRYFVFNGELYNFKQIQSQFQLPESKSDSLTAFHAFLQSSQKFLDDAVGMFAFAMFDSRINRLILVRDRFGKKPLYYSHQRSRFVFASSLDALVPHIEPKFRKSALKSYLSFRAVVSPQTFYENVYKLEPGAMLIFEHGKITVSKYFDFFADSTSQNDLYRLLERSVRHRLVSDAPLGAFLSGGIDSSTVCAMAALTLRQNGKKLHTFCVGYDAYEKDDERYYANVTAKKIGSEHTEIVFGKTEFLASLEKAISSLDEPISDPASLPLFEMCRVASSLGFKSVLSGEGGDEAFLGYDKYALMREINNAKNLPFAAYLAGFFERHPERNREWEWYRRALGGEILYRGIGENFTDEQKAILLNQKVAQRDSIMHLQKFYDEAASSSYGDYSSCMSYVDINIWLAEVLLQKADKIGMANSLEVRCPMMDSDFLRAAVTCGDGRFGQSTKWMLKELAQDLLPSEVLNRQKKGFSYPYNKWLIECADPEIVLELNKQTQFFNKAPLEFLYKNAKNGKFKQQFWSIYIFSKWYLYRF